MGDTVSVGPKDIPGMRELSIPQAMVLLISDTRVLIFRDSFAGHTKYGQTKMILAF